MNYLKKVKLIYLIFICTICLINNYVFSQENKEIIKQKERIEFEFKFLDRNYWTIKNNKNLIVISDFETGDKLICKGWHQEAEYRMIQNNLDNSVAEDPDNLFVYGGL